MGRSKRPKPTHLAQKLRRIREVLGLSQEKMVVKLNYTKSPLVASQISEFENDKREPPIVIVLAYARAANISMESLVDDDMDLPEIVPWKLHDFNPSKFPMGNCCPLEKMQFRRVDVEEFSPAYCVQNPIKSQCNSCPMEEMAYKPLPLCPIILGQEVAVSPEWWRNKSIRTPNRISRISRDFSGDLSETSYAISIPPMQSN